MHPTFIRRNRAEASHMRVDGGLVRRPGVKVHGSFHAFLQDCWYQHLSDVAYSGDPALSSSVKVDAPASNAPHRSLFPPIFAFTRLEPLIDLQAGGVYPAKSNQSHDDWQIDQVPPRNLGNMRFEFLQIFPVVPQLNSTIYCLDIA